MEDISAKAMMYKLSDQFKDMSNVLSILQSNQNEMKTELKDISTKMNDPEDGMIVKTIRNTEFREMCEPERNELISKFQGVLRWKSTIEWVAGIIFVALTGAAVKIIFFS